MDTVLLNYSFTLSLSQQLETPNRISSSVAGAAAAATALFASSSSSRSDGLPPNGATDLQYDELPWAVVVESYTRSATPLDPGQNTSGLSSLAGFSTKGYTRQPNTTLSLKVSHGYEYNPSM